MVHSIPELLPTCITSFIKKEEAANTLMVEAKCTFPSTFSGFLGHFPEKPILPAVIQLAIVRFIAEKAVQLKLEVLEYSRTKFKAMIKPEEEVQIHLSMTRSKNDIQGKFKIIKLDEKTVASGNYYFKIE